MPDVAAGPTVGGLLADGAERLQRSGVAEARRTAREILGAVLGREPGQVWLDRDLRAASGDAADFETRVARAVAGEPVAYVTGLQGFRSLLLAVDRRVLIPRPETEGLVDLVLEWARNRWGADGWGTAADVGTGSGCLALSLALEGAFARVVGTDASAEALAVARANAARLAQDLPIEWRHGSLLAPLADDSCDLIVSNPPYVSEAEWVALDRSVRDFEPHGALVSAEDGLAHTRRLLEDAPAVLAPGGLLALEIDARRADAALSLAQRGAWHEPVVRDDVFGRPRYLLATREWS